MSYTPVYQTFSQRTPNQFTFPYVDELGNVSSSYQFPYCNQADDGYITNPNGHTYNDAELQIWMLIYLAQAWSTIYLKNQNTFTPPSRVVAGYYVFPLNYGQSIGGTSA